eukprot:CAMPEP_0202702276 /NCGR_PEP_ID=MMETSP1385-20130828/15292_1 /ASSEMBLY_ACC=CAM_ASM_000861 /TAXON_ID=933848 /ORGANISM="Elphidium margaritaceum" /LENGTH=338 /DNA_ID=CAMNT_0049359897 /DNA_START=27 /DNA_END=1043 /DNA_ORIENTATION=-
MSHAENLNLLSSNIDYLPEDEEDENDDEFNMDFVAPPVVVKHKYHASRMKLPPPEQLEFDQTIEKEMDIEVTELELQISAYNQFVNRVGYALPFIYGFFFVAILCCYVTGFIEHDLKHLLIWALIGALFVAAVLGMYGIYRYGVISDHIDDIKFENQDYEHELKKLKAERESLKHEVKVLKTTVSELEHDAKQLAEQTEKFEGLVDELKELSKDNEDLGGILNDTNQIFADMRKVVLENERAHLLTAFYECAFRDAGDDAMDKNEYNRFLVRLTTKQRQRFEELGDFEKLADATGRIDIVKFQDYLEMVLENVDQLLRDEFEKTEAAARTRANSYHRE